MRTVRYPLPAEWVPLAQRPSNVNKNNLFDLVATVFDDIRASGDDALRKYSRKFDGVKLKSFEVSADEARILGDAISPDLKEAIAVARRNIEMFHRSQSDYPSKTEISKGVVCWRESRPIESVGVYVPGGSAPLFSTVLMLVVPAVIAGCRDIVLCTPPDSEGKINPAILYAASISGATRIFSVGGIQAIGAMAFGTETIPKVDKIFGPGNRYVTSAKQIAQMHGVAIDMPAGPSELLVIADDSCNPAFVAADLLSQAEHGPDSQVMLLSTSPSVIAEVCDELDVQLPRLARLSVAAESLANSVSVLFNSLDDCIAFSNLYAPEHLILAVKDAVSYTPWILNAGSVFLGNYSCESAGDYASGTNHTLPTNGFARAYSGVSLDSFVKKITFQHLSSEGLNNIGSAIEVMASAEQLEAHRNAVSIRMDYIKKTSR